VPQTVLPPFDTWPHGMQKEMAPLYDAIRDELEAAGLQVERLPILHGEGGRLLSWNTARGDTREAGTRAYVPAFGIPLLDHVALDAYRRLGIEAVPIDVARLAPYGGTVRCVTNVLAWREPAE